MTKTRSLRSAIDAKCKDCIYDDLERGRWREQVDACTVTECPLHAVRTRSTAARACVAARA